MTLSIWAVSHPPPPFLPCPPPPPSYLAPSSLLPAPFLPRSPPPSSSFLLILVRRRRTGASRPYARRALRLSRRRLSRPRDGLDVNERRLLALALPLLRHRGAAATRARLRSHLCQAAPGRPGRLRACKEDGRRRCAVQGECDDQPGSSCPRQRHRKPMRRGEASQAEGLESRAIPRVEADAACRTRSAATRRRWVRIGPADGNLDESLNTLRYANRARQTTSPSPT